MPTEMTRRDLMTRTLPAVALAGAALGAMDVFAQDAGSAKRAKNPVEAAVMAAFGGGEYRLPPLPYEYNALEPHIDEQTMRLHHDKHHQGYVDNLNKGLKAARSMKGEIDPAKLEAVQRDLSFNGGGHVLHTMFWATMTPDGGGEPQGALADAINQQYGSFDQFKAYFSKAASIVKGSGWGILAYEPIGDALVVFSANEHDTKLIAGTTPLLPLDVWEHAYYLKYQNKRADYIAAWWNVVNWSAVGESYEWIRSRYQQG